MKKDDTITIPVVGYMQRQPDGSYALVPEKSEYITVSADAVARFLMDGLHVPYEEAKR